MSQSVEQIQVFYEIAMSIGKGTNLNEMLKSSLLAYLRKLNCVAAMVYRTRSSAKSGYIVEDVFCLPYTLNIQTAYQNITSILCKDFQEDELEEFMQTLPRTGRTDLDHYFHIMQLENFGFLVLVRSEKPFDHEVLFSLRDLNKKLAAACRSSINIEALAESEKRYRDLAEFLPEMICETDLQGRLTYVNRYALQKMGYTLEEIQEGFSYRDIFHPDEQERLTKNFSLALKQDNRPPSEYRAVTSSGEEMAVIVHSNRLIQDDKVVGLRGVMIDISVRKRAEEAREKTEKALKISESTLKKHLRHEELVSEIMLKIYSSEGFRQRLNSVLEIIGQYQHWSRLTVFEDFEKGSASRITFEWCNKEIPRLIQEPEHLQYENIPSLKSGLLNKGFIYGNRLSGLPEDLEKFFQSRGSLTVLLYPLMVKGEIIGFVGFEAFHKSRKLDDIELELFQTLTGIISNAYERESMEQSIMNERDRANQANRAKSEFLANMSHEIRTPMNAILGFSEALYHDLESSQHQKMIKSILNSGNMLLSLLNDILDLSRVESGKLEITQQPIDLSHILEEIRLLFSGKAEKKGIELRTFSSPDFPRFLLLDEIRIKQVVFNLVGNAIKFTREGHVHIHTSFKNMSEKAGELVIEVEDTGIGIPESQKELIFEAFRQQSGQSSREFGGAGLGLPISRRLVEKMGGTIEVSSKEGEGSVFRVKVYCVRIGGKKIRKKEEFGQDIEISFDPANILVVDDIHSNITTVEAMLESSGLTVSSAENGEIGLEVLNHTSPELIILDIRMPVMDGYEFARILKSNDAWKSIPLIALTASVFDADKIKASGNFDGLLFKPVSRSDLFKQLSQFLSHQKGLILGKEFSSETEGLMQDLPAHLRKALPEICKQLEEKFLPEWETIKDQLVLFKIEKFAKELQELSSQYKFQLLTDYADKLLEEVETIDLESLAGTMGKFPLLLKQLSDKLNILNNV
jgi:PAS domain S-box-containing protein